MKSVLLAFIIATAVSCVDEPKKKELMKHPLDKSKTRKIVLENELKVYLLSDPDLNLASAALPDKSACV